ncbi:MAG: diaminopimelate decarboxylase, partial [Ruminococcaceae bacterium]|nr:diaminopimelate decarboxylase [Oscillospiraceae bacterium]
CDGEDELKALDGIARGKGKVQRILMRLTPGIDPHTNAKISTGNVDSKFGVLIANGDAERAVLLAMSLKNVKLCGFHCHLGSQMFDSQPFDDGAEIMAEFICRIYSSFGFETEVLNLGGGFGVPYTEDVPDFNIEENIGKIAVSVKRRFKEYGLPVPTVMLEPGRSIVADSGLTLYRCGSVKKTAGVRNYISVDGGMTDNPRYALYEARYTVYNAGKMNLPLDDKYTIAGRCCESGDILAVDTEMPKTERGDIIAVLSTGAYNYSMASNYNRIPRAPVVMLTENGEYTAVKRESFEDLVRNDL